MLGFLAREPFDNVFLGSLVSAGEPSIVVARDERGDVRGVAYEGQQLVFAVDELASVDAFFSLALDRPGFRAIVGPRRAVERFWTAKRRAFREPRTIRKSQPVFAIDRARLRGARNAIDAGRAEMREADELAANAARMAAGELDLAFTERFEASYRPRVVRAIEAGRFWRARDAGALVFQCYVGSVTPATAQLQGVWTPPAARGRGLATRALGAICDMLLDEHPSLCLYVNDFNLKAIALYERVGFRRVGEFSSIFF